MILPHQSEGIIEMSMRTALVASAAAGMISLTAVLAASPASAVTLGVSEGYKWSDGKNGNDVFNFNLSQPLGTVGVPVTIDGNLQDDWDRTTSKGSQPSVYKLDVGLKAVVFGPFYVRPALGYCINGGPNNANNFSYYSVTGGAVLPLTKKIKLEAKIRYRDAFDGANQFSTVNYGGGPSYNITSKDVIRAYVNRESGFGSSSRRDYIEAGLGYSHTF